MEKEKFFRFLIIYHHNDIELKYKLTSDLSNAGIDIIFYDSDIEDSIGWRELINKSISKVEGILLLLTQNSLSSSYMMEEFNLALTSSNDVEKPKLLLPVIIGKVDIPAIFTDRQIIFWKDNYEEVLAQITKAAYSFLEQNRVFLPHTNTDNVQNLHSSKTVEKRNYWLFKMNPETWKIDGLKINEQTFFSPYYLNQERPEFELFEKINKSDLVLCLAFGNFQGIVCIMEVTDPVGPDEKQGVVFKMVVERIIKPEISFQKIKNLIDIDTVQKLSESTTPPELFFPLTPEQFQNILDTKNIQDSEEGKIYQPFFLTEGNHKKTDDKLDFEKDYDSFASVIALEKVNPPLAIGLFGNWGSGKSFFMEKLAERIEFYAKSNDEKYIKDVVQVKFNSWHYSDANLWASLITEIFDSLKIYAKKQNQESEINKLQRTLKTTILERKVIDEKRKKLETSVKELEFDQAQKRRKLEDISGIKLLKQILSDKRIRNDLSELNNENIEKILENKNNIEQYISEVQDISNKTVFFLKELLNLRGWRWVIVILIGLIALIAPLLKNIFPSFWESITWQIQAYTAITATFLANLIGTIKPFKSAIQDALTRLQSLKKTMDSREQVENPKLTLEQSELNELQSSLVNLDIKIADTKENINDILSGRQLIKFIDERTKDESYSNALGVISWVRKDFITLDKLLREQHSINEKEKSELFNPEDVQLKIDRIILYIDDLDRCNEDVVVKVLEAIHLLLAFPLFVVVVGVDPRWLNNALSEKYKNLFGNSSKNNGKNDGSKESATNPAVKEDSLLFGAATSFDYLEKIFQIPFALKPIDKTGRENLIQYLMKNEMEVNNEAVAIDEGKSKKEKSKNKESNAIHGGLENGSGEKSNEKEGDSKEGVLSYNSAEEEKQTITKKEKERLLFTTDELAYMQNISSIFGQTPRTINRYINIYRIIKAHENLKVVGKYSKEEFMPIMFILGIIVGYAVDAEDFMKELSNAKNTDTFSDFINKSTFPKNLKKVISPFSSDFKTLTMEDFKRNKELISRFSFRQLMK